jgi:hypothetical protein
MRWAFLRATAATGCDGTSVIRWFIVILLALILINGLSPLLGKLGFGKLPGDFRFRLFGREWFLPVTTTLVLSMVVAGIAKFV